MGDSGIRYLKLLTSFALHSDGGRNVALLEILPFEQKRLADRFGERIGKAIAEVKSGRMVPLAEIRIGLPCNVGLFFGHRLDDNSSLPEECSKLARTGVLCLRLNDNRHFNEGSGGHAA